MNGDYYEMLGVDSTASSAQIKQGFKAQILKYHPDKCNHPSSSSLSASIIQAYRILSDPKERSEYDKELQMKVKRIKRHVEISSLEDLLMQAGMVIIECQQCGGKSYHHQEHFSKNQMVYAECEHCGLMICIE